MLRDNAILANALAHGFVIVEALALWLIVLNSTRHIGIVLGGTSCLAIGLIADQRLYAMLLFAGLLAYAQDLLYGAKTKTASNHVGS